MYEFGSTMSYNSGQLSVMKRLRRGFLRANYTFSKTLGTASSDTAKVSTIYAPRSRNYGPLNHDRTHIASLSYNYRPPDPGRALEMKWLSLLGRNWQVSGTTRIQSGEPFTPGVATTDNQDIMGGGGETIRPDVMDPSAPAIERFSKPNRATVGNAGWNVLRHPGMNNWDISALRSFRVAERKTLEFRFETYNTPNHTQFRNVFTTPKFDATTGEQTDILFMQPNRARDARKIALMLTLNW
jgi:hypothetical protein